jgi:aryl-alcohol dehydrogenase-like predicted oxidoreductase
MEYRSLGRTGVKVSPICLGCMLFGSLEQTQPIIDEALDAGINFLDTANVYGRGISESMVGQALAANGKRDRVVLATKVHGRMDNEDPNASGNSRRHILQQCDESLRRLRTDWIDLYQIHRPDPSIPIDETLRALDDLIRAGKIRYIGTSTYAAWQIVESLWVAQELGLNRFVCEQPPYHLLDRRIERELLPMARTYGLGVIPWSPLAGGFLTGRYTRENYQSVEGRHGGGKQRGDRNHFTDQTFQVVEKLEQMAQTKQCKTAHLALAWCRDQPGVTSPIVGARTLEHLREAVASLTVEVTDEDRQALDELSPPGGVLVPYYKANWGPHDQRV